MEKIQQKVAELLVKVSQTWQSIDWSDVHVVMNGRLTSTAGRAWMESGKLEFSKKLYAENEEAFLADTVIHELAHIVAYRVYGDRGHGNGWRTIMEWFGLEAKRCHTYAVQRKTTSKKYEYVCGCVGKVHEITPQRQSWIDRGKRYSCQCCGKIITAKI